MAMLWTFPVIAACNLMLLSAIAAGRARRRWRRGVLLTAELALLAIWLVGSILLEIFAWGYEPHGRGDVGAGLVALVAMAMSVFAGGIATYAEYIVVGRRYRFRDDLKQSLWIGRGGLFRLGGGPVERSRNLELPR